MEGILKKWTNYYYGYQERYFVLEEATMTISYFLDKEHFSKQAARRGCISLMNCTLAVNPELAMPLRFDIKSSAYSETQNESPTIWYVVAPTASVKHKWILSITELKVKGAGLHLDESSRFKDFVSKSLSRYVGLDPNDHLFLLNHSSDVLSALDSSTHPASPAPLKLESSPFLHSPPHATHSPPHATIFEPQQSAPSALLLRQRELVLPPTTFHAALDFEEEEESLSHNSKAELKATAPSRLPEESECSSAYFTPPEDFSELNPGTYNPEPHGFSLDHAALIGKLEELSCVQDCSSYSQEQREDDHQNCSMDPPKHLCSSDLGSVSLNSHSTAPNLRRRGRNSSLTVDKSSLEPLLTSTPLSSQRRSRSASTFESLTSLLPSSAEKDYEEFITRTCQKSKETPPNSSPAPPISPRTGNDSSSYIAFGDVVSPLSSINRVEFDVIGLLRHSLETEFGCDALRPLSDVYLRTVLDAPGRKTRRAFKQTLEKLQAVLLWRIKCSVSQLDPSDFSLSVLNSGALYWYGYDLQHRPILWVRPDMRVACSLQEEIDLHVLMIEYGLRHYMPENRCSFTLVAYSGNFYPSQTNINLMKALVDVVSKGYPDRLASLYVGPVGWLVSSLFALLKPLLPSSVLSKIVLMDDPPSTLCTILPEGSRAVPRFLNGPHVHEFACCCKLKEIHSNNSQNPHVSSLSQVSPDDPCTCGPLFPPHFTAHNSDCLLQDSSYLSQVETSSLLSPSMKPNSCLSSEPSRSSLDITLSKNSNSNSGIFSFQRMHIQQIKRLHSLS